MNSQAVLLEQYYYHAILPASPAINKSLLSNWDSLNPFGYKVIYQTPAVQEFLSATGQLTVHFPHTSFSPFHL